MKTLTIPAISTIVFSLWMRRNTSSIGQSSSFTTCHHTMSTDPKIADPNHPFYASKIGMDCTIPLVGDWDPDDFSFSSALDLGDPPTNVTHMTEEQVTADMTEFIKAGTTFVA
jgi:hypothetical protein